MVIMGMNILAQLETGVITESPEETQALAAALVPCLPPEVTLALHGNLGVGKTTWVQGLARALGITQPLTSPTFTLFNLYRAPDGRTLLHMDAYRLETAAAMDALMVEDFMRPPYCLVIEWPERIAEWLPHDTWHFDLSVVAPGKHRLSLRAR